MPTLSDCLFTFLQIHRSPQTNRQYKLVLDKLVTAIGPERDITLIRYEDLLDYFARLRDKGLKSSTLSGYTSVAKAFFTWCVRRKYIPSSPADDIVRRHPGRTPDSSRAVPPDELARMIEYAHITSPRNYAMMLFMADTGCRVGGLVSLEIKNLHLSGLTAEILEKGETWVDVFFGEKTAAALAAWLDKRPSANHDYVWTGDGPFYTPLTRAGVAAVVNRLAERTDASRIWGPHSIRHAVGHAYARQYHVTVTQRKLNHRSPAITIKHYYPDSDAYVAQVSRRNELLALKPLDEEEQAALHLIKKQAK